ncbi:MAG: TRAP transporter substrate-binding protein [Synergistaceae bacterium]|jgi:C4-dicarboxylate-binding protein DctP|nr:TRAP transporter substrate-binding protein [Synergistaceae bacterium]
MKVSRIVSIVLVCVMSVAVPSVSSGEPLLIRFSHNQPVGSPEDVGAQALRAKLEELAGDRVEVEVYPASQLGSLREQVESTQMGVIQLTLQPASVITPFVDDIKIIDFPYLLPADRNKVFKVLDGELGQEGLSPLSRAGFKGLGYWFAGYKLFTTKKTEIHSPADFKGLRIRVMDSPLLISQYTAWGATAVPIAYAELYNSLQQNVVDGQENPIQTIALNNYQEVQGQIIQSYHGTMTYILMANKQWFDGLDPELQGFIVEAEKFGRAASRENYAVQETNYIETVKKAPNVHYYALTDAEIAQFREASKPVYAEHATTDWQKAYLKKLQEAFAK